MIELQDVHKTYDTGTKALNGISMKIDDGEFVFLVGPSGSGKSTIIKILTAELRPTSGSALVNGFAVEKLRGRAVPYLRRTLGVIFQDFRLISDKSVYENVAFAMRVIGAPEKEIQKRVPYVLELVGLETKGRRLPNELSGGEQQRVAIARALVNNPSVIIADEPTGNLDPARSLEIMMLLEQINALGTTVLVVTHERELVNRFTKRVVAILKKHGKRAVCWNDVLESKDVDTGNIIQYWTAQHEAPVPAFIERGGKVIFSNMSALYFDYPHGINSLNKVYHYQPVVMGKSYADSPNMLGYEAALWSEQVETPEHLEELLFPRLYAVSEIAWNEAGDYADFEHRAEKKIEIAAKQGVNCMTKDGWNPEGEARVQSAATFIAHMMNPGGIGTPHTDAEREMVRPVIEKFAQIWFRPQDVPEMMKNDDLVGAALNFMKMFPPENDETKGE